MATLIEDQLSSRDDAFELSSITANPSNSAALAPLAPQVSRNAASTRSSTKKKIMSSLIVLSAFISMFTSCGLNFAFGVYQELYESMSSSGEPGPFRNASPAQIDLIGTLAVSLMSLGAPFASGWCKSYSPRTITFAGALIFALANVLASFSQKLWQFILTQGVLLGVGTCLTYIPAVTVTPGWFGKHRGLAIGILSSGTGVGGVAWAPVLRALNDSIGFRNTLRLTGGLSFLLLSFAAAMLKWEPSIERQNRLEMRDARSRLLVPLIDWRVARSRKFVAQCTSAGLQAAAYYAPVYFFSSYARTLGYSAATGATFISLSNASSAIGKVVIGYLADRLGRLNVLLFATFVSAVSALGLWLPSTLSDGDRDGRNLFIAFSILYGIFAGAYISLFPTALVELFGVQHFASVNGFLYMVRGFTALIGTPIAGALIRGNGGDAEGPRLSQAYFKTSILVGALLAGTTAAVAWVRIEAIGSLSGVQEEDQRRKWRV